MTRELVLEILLEVLEKDGFSNVVIHNTLAKYQYMDKQDRAFLTRLSEGTIERVIELDYVINSFSKIKVKKMKPVIRNIIRMGTYQILYMKQVPDHAACNEAVKLAIKKGFHNLKGFVNGVLRNISREKENLKYPQPAAADYLSIVYSMPQWIIDLWSEEYSRDTIEKILKGFFEEKETTIRVNTCKTTKETLMKELEAEEVTVEEGRYLSYALRISNYNYLNGLDSFRNGYFQIQDESSMMAAACAGIKEGDTVLDLCAAPGGKTTHASQLLKGSGQVIARDLTENKCALIEENVSRLALTNVKTQIQDALCFDDSMKEKADIVFADLPCSGLGVMRRKGDIKYKTKEKDILSLAKLQREILAVVWQYVKPGGILIYSTCTINHYENLDNAKWFQENFPFIMEPLIMEPLQGVYFDKINMAEADKGFLQLLPGIHDTDGFFLSRFRRKENL